MKGEEIIIELNANDIALNAEVKIGYSYTSLPTSAFKFKTLPLYWRVQITGYDNVYEYVTVEVLNYNEDHYYSLNLQEIPYRIHQVNFATLNWNEFKPLLEEYNLDKLMPFIDLKEPFVVKIEEFTEIREIRFDDATFMKGKVVFEVEVYSILLKLEVANTFLKAEYDFIKKWFRKKFRKDSFRVALSGTRRGQNIIEIKASSDDILSINNSHIEDIAKLYLSDQVKEFFSSSTKGTRTIDTVVKGGKEIFPTHNTPLEILQRILKTLKVRNERELDYLSSHPKVESEKIRMTSAEQDGFVFSYLVGNKRIFVWELLKSNASYIWIFANSLPYEEMVKLLDLDISLIQTKEVGRQKFKSNFQDLQRPYEFIPISHNIQDEGGFEEWKLKVQAFIQ